ncbi:peptide deformylase [Myxococcota bacterium]|nr:peptide deformylase [Myxococcota bacterium]MBU1496025.1 peptide deformylase [Myxococcota bacterium]
MEILQFGEPRLREKTTEVKIFKRGLHETVDLMKDFLEKADNAAAVAANQLGIMKSISVIDYVGEYLEIINPVIIASEGEQRKSEGCLSLPGYWGEVPRAQTVTVRYQDRFGETHEITRSGKMAVCLQHEIDHLNGILFIDHMEEPVVENPSSGKELSVIELKLLTLPK